MNTRISQPIKFNPFFAGHVVIRPSGRRKFCYSYVDYCKTIMFFLEDTDQGIAQTSFSTCAVLEEELEKRFNLPEEHLLGVTEVYSTMIQVVCAAKFESDRFERNCLLEHATKSTHLDLYLVASLQPGQRPDCDIIRKVRHEERTGCTCLFCWPSIDSEPLWVLNKVELEKVSKWLHISPLTLNVYIPFRRANQRANALDPLAIQEVKEPE